MPDWKYILAASSDMETIQELKLADSRSLVFDNNKSGQLSCDYPLEAPNAGRASPWETCIIAQRDTDVLWSGPISGWSGSLAGGRFTINAVDWFELLMHILVQEKLTGPAWTDKDAGTLVSQLLDHARAQDPRLPITMGINETTQTRTVTYDIDANIGQEIMNLAELESGYDWYVDPILRTLNIVERRGTRQDNCKWVYIQEEGKPARGNCKDIQPALDGTIIVNDIKPRGRSLSGQAIDAESQFRYFLRQEAPALSDVVDPNILNAYANAEIVYRKDPRLKYTILPQASNDATSDPDFPVPVYGKDFVLGDTGFMTAKRGFINQVDLPVRFFTVGLQIDRSGGETITSLSTSADAS